LPEARQRPSADRIVALVLMICCISLRGPSVSGRFLRCAGRICVCWFGRLFSRFWVDATSWRAAACLRRGFFIPILALAAQGRSVPHQGVPAPCRLVLRAEDCSYRTHGGFWVRFCPGLVGSALCRDCPWVNVALELARAQLAFHLFGTIRRKSPHADRCCLASADVHAWPVMHSSIG